MNYKLTLTAAILASCMICACGDDDNTESPTPEKPTVVENTPALCSDGDDNDNNGKADCDDSNCAGLVFCQSIDPNKENSPKTCNDGIDNDSNGKKDCEETTCQKFTLCKSAEPENTEAACKDGLDNNKNGQRDCDDPDCASFCKPAGDKVENTDALCHDSKDNDEDGKIDCDDPDCKSFCGSPEEKKENTNALCSDKIDNDEDDKIDCDDPDCKSLDVCNTSPEQIENSEELCKDGKDNDKNGKADCDDPNCKNLDICTTGGKTGEKTIEKCTNGTDDDGDGKVDCDDPECSYFQNCLGIDKTGENSEAACKDNNDNDGDGWIDCADAECQKYDFCNDACTDDPFKFVEDSCQCGETKLNDDCYINISTPQDFEKLKDSNKKYIIKRPIDFGDIENDPITGFSGTLNGNNMRITGFFTQEAKLIGNDVYECGLFGKTSGTPTFTDINLAITVNCTDNNYKNIHVGGLVSNTNGNIKNILSESKVMLRSIMPTDKKRDGGEYNVMVGGLVGLHETGSFSNVDVVGNTSAQIEWGFNTSADSKTREINIGGVIGKTTTDLIANVNVKSPSTISPSTITLTYNLTTLPKESTTRVGGIAGYAVSMDMCSNNGGSILVNHKNGENEKYNHFIGGLVGQVHRVTNSSFTGTLTSNGAAGKQVAAAAVDKTDSTPATKAYAATNIGGIAGYLAKDNYTGSDKEALDGCFVDAQMRLIAGPGMHAGGLLGRMGEPKSDQQKTDDNFYIVNSYSKVELTVNAPTTAYDNTQFYWGGAVSQAAQNGWIVNSHLRTDYMVDNFNLGGVSDTSKIFLGGVVSKNDLGVDEYGGQLVNNFISGKPVAAEESENLQKFKGNMAATYGYYIYESYWDANIYGEDKFIATQAILPDDTTQPYTFNASNVAELKNGTPVLTLLRKNIGRDGGVKSANLPNKIEYSNWEQVTDKDGHKVPVPELIMGH